MARWKASTRLWALGALLTSAGFGSAVASILRDQSVVESFVRMPAECATTVRVANSGDFVVYYENKGIVGEVGGCSNDDRSYDNEPFDPDASEDDTSVSVTLNITDDSGESIVPAILLGERAEYRTPDYEGTAIFTVSLEADRDYTFDVQADDPSAVVSLGREVNTTSGVLLLTGVGLIVVGAPLLAIGVVKAARQRRRRRTVVDWSAPSPEDRAPTGGAEP
ncbi:MAG: hypothetical protein B7C54_07080 [Acidimicrobiales bacterium mtb01]|nr:hypothetical protein [Actinomycetota bacterium]TEX44903.1 MAG: hypothetical protein B7C54_07080 [Acidimicrobiales bacterium mtb01]